MALRAFREDGPMSHSVRHLVKGVTQAPAVATMRIRTRLRPSQEDTVVLACLGQTSAGSREKGPRRAL